MTDTVLNQRHGAWIRVFVMVVKAQRVQEDFVHRNQSGANKTACAFNFKTTQGVLFKMSPRKCKNMTNEASVYDAHFLFFFSFFLFFSFHSQPHVFPGQGTGAEGGWLTIDCEVHPAAVVEGVVLLLQHQDPALVPALVLGAHGVNL